MMMDLSAILLLAVAAPPPADARERAEAYYFYSLGQQARLSGSSDEALSEYGRRAAHTVYHPAGTCAIGSVVDGDLKVIGLEGLRVVDASVFPTMPTVNPMVTVLMIGERAADLIREA